MFDVKTRFKYVFVSVARRPRAVNDPNSPRVRLGHQTSFSQQSLVRRPLMSTKGQESMPQMTRLTNRPNETCSRQIKSGTTRRSVSSRGIGEARFTGHRYARAPKQLLGRPLAAFTRDLLARPKLAP